MALGPFQVAERLSEGKRERGIALLMRHGETAWNREGRVMGRQPVDLDEGGRAQVEMAVALARELALDLIISSPLPRATQSAEIIARGVGGIDILTDDRLEEVRYGAWEGKTYQQLIHDESYINYRKAPLESLTPGGETIRQVQQRGVAAVDAAVTTHRGKHILFISHGDIIRTVLCHYMRLDLIHFHRLRVDNATFSGVEISDDFAEVKFVNLLPDPARAFRSPFPK
ncbi:MAG TPA: histidine phosphatase family protein [Candidatus Binataceae bacterium]|jgi:broad specificity phosphatase PhoE|nr:histidine phosphatase family protein [Candidatus Binataceae bacterium]